MQDFVNDFSIFVFYFLVFVDLSKLMQYFVLKTCFYCFLLFYQYFIYICDIIRILVYILLAFDFKIDTRFCQ